jgi:GTP-binding protein
MGFTVAIVGRPNVGKSTLFNRLVGRRAALVDDLPGVTRDRKEGQGRLGELDFTVVDTAGLEVAKGEKMEARMRAQTETAILLADVCLFLIDARAGVTPLDSHFAQLLRRGKTPVILVANKCEGKAGQPGLYESYGLGLGEPVAISAEHAEGLSELLDALRVYAPPPPPKMEEEEIDPAFDPDTLEKDDPSRPIRLAIVGRPNVGKSTLINRLLDEERLITGPEAGLTRDAIEVPWSWKGRPMVLIDTAGVRKRGRIDDRLERLSTEDTRHSIRFAQVVVLVVDAERNLDRQDLILAEEVAEEGRALVIALNKWDLKLERDEVLQKFKDRIERSLAQVKGVAWITVSGMTGKGLDKLMNAVLEAYRVWNGRVPTAKLNRWLEEMTERHPPPAVRGKRLRLRYMTQVATRPPRFVVFSTKPEELPGSYMRYLENSLREFFDLPGTPIRINLRKPKNPYDDKE